MTHTHGQVKDEKRKAAPRASNGSAANGDKHVAPAPTARGAVSKSGTPDLTDCTFSQQLLSFPFFYVTVFFAVHNFCQGCAARSHTLHWAHTGRQWAQRHRTVS